MVVSQIDQYSVYDENESKHVLFRTIFVIHIILKKSSIMNN